MAVRLLQETSLPIDGNRLGPVLVASIAPVFEDREKTVPKRDADSSLPLWAVTVMTADGGVGEVKIAADKPPTVVGKRVTLDDLVARAWEIEGRHGISFRAAKLMPAAEASWCSALCSRR